MWCGELQFVFTNYAAETFSFLILPVGGVRLKGDKRVNRYGCYKVRNELGRDFRFIQELLFS